MPTFSRREALLRFAALAAFQVARKPALACAFKRSDSGSEQKAAIPVRVHPSWGHTISTISPQMLGLSYESSQLSAPDFFSAANSELIGLFKKLSPRGVLRLGGNLSEYTRWAPDDPPVPSGISFRAVKPDPSSGKRIQPVAVTPAAIRNLRDFLDSTGWQAIYGLNLAFAQPARVAAEAKAVAEALGRHLIAFQIGNEPNHYVLNRLRAPGYSFADYFAEWTKIHRAVLNAVPTAHFAGPDVAEDVSWIERFAAAAPASVTMLTGHHYAEGPPSSPSVTVEKLLSPDPDFDRRIEEIEAISLRSRMPYVMAETNSCYMAGKEGVSDVFAAALWAADYILQLAQAGERGVYFHGGGASFYTPIAGGSGHPFVPCPVYYGLLFCRSLLGCELTPVAVTHSPADVAVYAVKHPRRIIAINKCSSDIVVQLPPGEMACEDQRLSASSPESKAGITLSVPLPLSAPLESVTVPRFSAAAITLQETANS